MRGLLADTAHRPTPLPAGPWVMFQRWHDLLFAHWQVAPEVLRGELPGGLELELFEGQAWLGVVPFRMSGVRLRGTPALPGLAAFPELNVRTYVRHRGKRGVWFFSLEAANRLAVRVARSWFHLPYFDAAMELVERGGEIHYRSRRTHRGAPAAELVARYAPCAPVERAEAGSLEEFLTERYALFAHGPRGLSCGEIHHRPWPLQAARAVFEHNTMAGPLRLGLDAAPAHLAFARVLDVLIWAPRTVPR
ncbi:MAG: DUF2071 domain-containing protein [Planctomycetes bacterium]|nr:DUF2071 domain-containing protein [Planctomycetota bacterium]